MAVGSGPVALRLMGPPALVPDGGAAVALPRRAAALLAVLALEGPTSRARLADLLWPDADGATARNDLSQTLRRIHARAGGRAVVSGRDRLQLAAETEADARRLLDLHREGRAAELAALPGVLLADLSFDDCEDLADWLDAARFRVDRLRAGACRQLADRAEAQGDAETAADWLERLVELEPCAEDAWRRLMALRFSTGDRGRALAAYARCADVLRREVDAEPADETRALAERIRRARASAPRAGGRGLPPQVLRPPLLVGREREWREMEAAWARGVAIFLAGPPGAGKSRLMREFLAAKGAPYVFEGRPEDSAIPYATHARTYRQMLEYFPGLDLPAWVERELARLLPERGPAPEGEVVPLRFLEAQSAATRLAVEAGMRCVGVDDLQFVDMASLVAGHFVYAPHWGRVDGMRTVLCFREGELRTEAESMLEQALATGVAVRVGLEPLSEAAVGRLVESLGVGLEAHAPALARRSGGNPLFVLEMVRSLLDRGPASVEEAALMLPGRVRQLVAARLARLRPEARDLMRVAALAGERFGAALAARVLDVPLVRLSDPWAELEAAQVLRGERFAHDLVAEVVRSEIPAALRDELLVRIEAATGPGNA